MREREQKDYIGYEYKEIHVPPEEASWYLDCYENFGWNRDENIAPSCGPHWAALCLKRDRKIINKMELTRLQQHFEACMREIGLLQKEKTSLASGAALTTALAGTAFMAGSTFAVVHEPPMIWLCILLAVPGFMGWILPYFIYHRIVRKKVRQLQPLIEAKREEIYAVCEKGHSLL